MKHEPEEATKFNLIIPQGTQVVLLNEVKVLNENRFQPRGSIGVITGLPSDAFHAYKIKFPDQTEGMAGGIFPSKNIFRTSRAACLPEATNSVFMIT